MHIVYIYIYTYIHNTFPYDFNKLVVLDGYFNGFLNVFHALPMVEVRGGSSIFRRGGRRGDPEVHILSY